MLPFRTEIRNSPKEQTLKVYLSDISLDRTLKDLIENLEGVRLVEVQRSLGRNRVRENITVYRENNTDINSLKEKVDTFLNTYFERVDI
ncbi:MAG: hypothetical protein ACPHXR_07730 [Flavicella sp.]